MRTGLKGFAGAVARKAVAAYSYIRFAGQKNLRTQIDRHVEHWNLDNAIAVSHVLVARLAAAGLERDARILVVGCCNMLEIYTFFSYGYRHVQGIDLVSHNPRYIRVMDMHNMSFDDSSFDAIYCAGVLQCTDDAPRLAREFSRVLKPCGIVAISAPINFPTSKVYPYNAGSVDSLHQVFGARPADVVWGETLLGSTPTNPNASETVRSIFRLNKESRA